MTGGPARYVFNPECACVVCVNGGRVPDSHPDRGHGFGYDEPHAPPRSRTWHDQEEGDD